MAYDLAPFRAILGERGVIDASELVEPWLHDWRGKYHGAASAIVSPQSTSEVAAVMRLAMEQGIPLVPQGGNTSMVGGATPPADGRALILSLRRMNHIRSISAEDNLAVCEAGVVLSTLHDAAGAVGRRFPLSLGAKGSATIGGLISTNAGGTQVLRHGTMRALVEGIEAVLPDGSIYSGLAALKKNNCGPDFKQLLIGAEGTLGIVTAASLRLKPAIVESATAWIAVKRPHDALALLRHLETCVGPYLEAFELIADDGLGHVLNYLPDARCPVTTRAPWYALVELALEKPEGAVAMLEEALTGFMGDAGFVDATIAQSESQAATFWALRDSLSAAERAVGPALQFDISVPVAAMPDWIETTSRAAVAAFPGTSASAYGHLGDGNVHFHVRAPVPCADGSRWLTTFGQPISQFVHDAVVAAAGSISAEHGIGQMKRDEFARLGDPAQKRALIAIKQALDPLGLMNPGKLIPLASDP